MFANRYLGRWREAGLIDDEAARRITAWEASQARPVWLWALAGLGAFALSMGVLAIVAANWERIPGWLKIAANLSLNAAAAAGLLLAWMRGWQKTRELLGLILAGLVLSGIALISQVYQLDGEVWQALLIWLASCTPFVVLATRSRLLGIAWALGASATWIAAIEDLERFLASLLHGEAVILLVWVSALLLLVAGLARRWMPEGRAQGDAIIGCGVLGLLFAASFPQLIVFRPAQEAGTATAIVLSLLVAALLWRETQRGERGASALLVMVLAGLGTWLATIAIWRLFGSEGGAFWQRRQADALPHLLAALVFIAFWATVSWLVLRAGRRALFAAGFAVIVVRVFILYWEAFGGLLNTGLGLIGGGLLCLGLAAAGWHIARRSGRPVEAAI